MKHILSMKLFAHGAMAALLGFASIASAAGTDAAIVQTIGGVTYVSGGVGAESIDQLGAISRDFNLKLVFALRSGDYLSGVNVVIADAAGKTMINTVSDGPWFLTKLPSGNYQIVATFAGANVTRQAAVGATNLNTIDMRWASE